MTFPEMVPMDRRINLGNVLTIAALLLGLAGSYAAFAARVAVIESKLETIVTSLADQKAMQNEIYDLRSRIHTLEREAMRGFTRNGPNGDRP